MNFGHYSNDSVALAVDLVNTSEPTVDDTSEELATPADLERFLADHGLTSTVEPRPGDLLAVHALREQLRRVFAAPDDAEAAATLNELLAESDLAPRLSDHDGQHWHLHVASQEADAVAQLHAITSLGLALVLAQGGKERLGVCADQDCIDAFVDSSKNSSRRYCSEGCANRANVRAFRARARAEEAPGTP